MIVVSDTSPITSLAGIGQLDILRQLYGRVIIPQAVYREMVCIERTVPGASEVQSLAWIETQQVYDLRQVEALRSELDAGEAEAIILAMELKADFLIIDERFGRKIASQYGINLTGVLGVLLEAKRKGLILAIKPLMDRLINEVEFRVSEQLYNFVLNAAGE
ncbi:DUF3368 domain-containing protein [Oscillatoria sp. FACHB-1406]|uniref:DUF3368 domain-containing protein n=1 Tax=Oscillatoria sp. FACHB-1406 TaxID=2692846 RepID=UPI001682524F|nr:DUF3368 domain-containing protein [Oscillatoria sp. FACHB-1406]MBD2576575.1 DUF3368 domain-containing protein [Oscillatoria sp. FACHB-1406]